MAPFFISGDVVRVAAGAQAAQDNSLLALGLFSGDTRSWPAWVALVASYNSSSPAVTSRVRELSKRAVG